MTIQYSLTRFEVVRTFLYALPRSPRMLAVIVILCAWPGFIWLTTKGALSRGLTLTDVAYGVIWMASAFIVLILWIFIRAKTKARTLSISETGIHTEIGRIKADLPWKNVRQVSDVGPYIIVVNRTGNAFFIPTRAFADSNNKTAFVSELSQYRSARYRAN